MLSEGNMVKRPLGGVNQGKKLWFIFEPRPDSQQAAQIPYVFRDTARAVGIAKPALDADRSIHGGPEPDIGYKMARDFEHALGPGERNRPQARGILPHFRRSKYAQSSFRPDGNTFLALDRFAKGQSRKRCWLQFGVCATKNMSTDLVRDEPHDISLGESHPSPHLNCLLRCVHASPSSEFIDGNRLPAVQIEC